MQRQGSTRCAHLTPLAICVGFVLFAGLSLSTASQAQSANSSLAIPETDEGLPGAGPIRRYDWFRNLWETRRRGWAESRSEDHHAVVFLGDSIIQGWGTGLPEAFPGIKVANRGISGDTSRGVLIRLEEDVLSLDPQAVVLLIGTNDLEEAAQPQTVAANVKLILDALSESYPNMPVLLCEVFPSASSMSRPAASIQQINALLAELAPNYPQLQLLPTYALFADDDGDAKLAEFPDLLHPNELGYRKWASALRPLLSAIVDR